ncbi:MAG: tRNA pseudouridine(55) synthase TruB [Clostridiales bacterium]|jgi:tRNA pseudouridine55 synthase|nr:tRNA pseudouridine(55) synthase TruB [Clostridiales bacterium]HOA34198.1 tRNA pseudouridine(55) synthase TruB [Clostridiales bacterium]HPU67374.1 tRNA pseudouridine(55) synthase TruB [Clostridiales bacterium]HQA05159.1 tRNA pseudouridine(55) synthase TruB [Clostridiales bacterium]HQD72286.1 tRNA pseudouridine(55) synthase TruB [Clostridiales bacterium]
MTGFCIIDKPEGLSSFQVSRALRRIFNEKKTGHIGTLDPMATGVLPVAVGGATRFIPYIPDEDKEYIARFRLGIRTDTLDITGKVTDTSPVTATADEVEKILERFRGRISQVPPMYSALSKDGVKLYKLARQGIETEREAREISVYSLELTNVLDYNEYEIKVSCSKGTYIRSLIDDIGTALGTHAVMTYLRRTASNGFSIDEAVPLDALSEMPFDAAAKTLISIDAAMSSYPEITVTEAQAKRFLNGGALSIDRLKNIKTDGLFRVYSPDRRFLGLGEAGAELLNPKRVINADE